MKTYPYIGCSFNTLFGIHQLKFVVNDTLTEEYKIFVFPMKYFAVDYYGNDFYPWKIRDYAFVVTEGLTPIAIE